MPLGGPSFREYPPQTPYNNAYQAAYPKIRSAGIWVKPQFGSFTQLRCDGVFQLFS